jgi:hypothetical protein
VLSNNVLPDFSRCNDDSLCLWRLLVFKFLCTGDRCRPPSVHCFICCQVAAYPAA